MAISDIEPGTGAVEYARSLTAGMTREQAAIALSRAYRINDARIKRCDYCGYLFRDESKRNLRQTCCGECKTALKTLQRRQQRADKALLTGEPPKVKRKTKRDVYYVWWLEYPFWLSEYEMLKQTWKYEVSHDTELMDAIQEKNMTYGAGNRKRGNLSGDNRV
ncbi:hypothetical protein [Paenibacillus sp. SI8]|uniref:hypothetical protein n=1 Tax=unclassified Paenibacillus TaxID=185978 RepID=UPI003465FFE3